MDEWVAKLEQNASDLSTLPLYDLSFQQQVCDVEFQPDSLLAYDVNTVQCRYLIEKDLDGGFAGIDLANDRHAYEEIGETCTDAPALGGQASTSYSMQRLPQLNQSRREATRGQTTWLPFKPAFEDAASGDGKREDSPRKWTIPDVTEINWESPQFPRGIAEFEGPLPNLFTGSEDTLLDWRSSDYAFMPHELWENDVPGQNDDVVGSQQKITSSLLAFARTPVRNQAAAAGAAGTEIVKRVAPNVLDLTVIAGRDDLFGGGGQTQREDRAYNFAVRTDVSMPITNFRERVPKLAREWPFELDIFQKQAICSIEQHQSVFVAAHTSAGKTVVAEYAIAKSLAAGNRVIYTSPIKALSNQKLRDFRDAFGVNNCGLLTGDVQLNAHAPCLVMTTEILRSMLYRGADIIRDLAWVIFDEVHYINDEERGVVWEEILIMLPSHVKVVMLSATVPNIMAFADWVGRTRQETIYVMSTLKRPVPLEHSLYMAIGNKSKDASFVIMNQAGMFIEANYRAAMELKKSLIKAVAASEAGSNNAPSAGGRGGGPNAGGRGGYRGGGDRGGRGGYGRGGGGGNPHQQNSIGLVSKQCFVSGAAGQGGTRPNPKQEKTLYISFLHYLIDHEWLPVVVFVFSRNRCDELGRMLLSQDLTTAVEKSRIHHYFHKAVARLKGSDRELPQVLQMELLAKNGIAVHHSGILPILKEIVEILFQQGLIKVLFATETFAMGVNMPARTVVFDSTRKHDGTSFRWLLSSEYIQMSGRAGRRGLDPVGRVIILCKGGDLPDFIELERMMKGAPTSLTSRFRLTYGMILNLLRVERIRIHDMIRRSFGEYDSQRARAVQQSRLDELREKLAHAEAEQSKTNDLGSSSAQDCMYCASDLSDYVEQRRAYDEAKRDVRQQVYGKDAQWLKSGRLIMFTPSTLEQRGTVLAAGENDDLQQMPSTFEIPNDVSFFGVLVDISEPKKVLRHDRRITVAFLLPNGGAAKTDRLVLTESTVSQIDAVYKKYTNLDATGAVFVRKFISQHAIVDEKVVGNNSPLPIAVAEIYGMLKKVGSISVTTNAPSDVNLAQLDFVRDFHVKEMDTFEQLTRLQTQRALFESQEFTCKQCPDFDAHVRQRMSQAALRAEIAEAETKLSDESLALHPDYANRLEVLKQMRYITSRKMVELKGRIACEINQGGYELLITELIIGNVFESCTVEETAALLSALVYQGKQQAPLIELLLKNERSTAAVATNVSGQEQQQPVVQLDNRFAHLSTNLQASIVEFIKIAAEIDQAQKECGVVGDKTSVVESLNFDLAQVVLEWARGMSFAEIMQLTDVQEGVIVRAIVRLDELCRDIKTAAKLVGLPSLPSKMEEVSLKIRRDIVFTASLYTVESFGK